MCFGRAYLEVFLRCEHESAELIGDILWAFENVVRSRENVVSKKLEIYGWLGV